MRSTTSRRTCSGVARARAHRARRHRASARTSTVAALRWSTVEVRVATRHRDPSGSRTIGQPTTSTGRSRSAAIRRTTASCCASLRPKYAAARSDDREQLRHDGRDAVEVGRASRAAQARGELGDVHGRDAARPTGTSRRRAARTARRRPPPRRSPRRRRDRGGRPRDPRSAPNCSGFTKRLTTTRSSRRVRRASANGGRRGSTPWSGRARPCGPTGARVVAGGAHVADALDGDHPRPPAGRPRPGAGAGRGRHDARAGAPTPPAPRTRPARPRGERRGGGRRSPDHPERPVRSARLRARAPPRCRATPASGRNASNGTPADAARRSTWPSSATRWFDAIAAAA